MDGGVPFENQNVAVIFSLFEGSSHFILYCAHRESPAGGAFNILLMEQGVSLNRLRNGIDTGFRELVMEFHAVV